MSTSNPLETCRLDRSLRRDCERAYNNALSEGESRLSREDYKVAALELLGYKPSKYEVDSVWSTTIGSTGTGRRETGHSLDLEQFTAVMLTRLKGREKDEIIREIFLCMDIYQRGFLTESDCISAFHQVAPGMKREMVQELFWEVDLNGDGRISYSDFELLMKSSPSSLATKSSGQT